MPLTRMCSSASGGRRLISKTLRASKRARKAAAYLRRARASAHQNSDMAEVASPTRTIERGSPRVEPVFTTLSDLPAEYQSFATRHGLTLRDVIGLLHAPTLDEHLNEQRLMVLVIQLETAVQEHDFDMSDVILCMLIRSDLQRVYGAACECGLGWVARQAGRQTAPQAGATARLGRVLVSKLENLAASKLAAVRASEARV